MSRQRGFTVVELLVASAVMLVVLAGAATVLHDAIARVPVLEEASDLHQRARIAVELLSAELRAAGAGLASDPAALLLPGVMPRDSTASPATAVGSVLTVRYIPDGAAISRLQSPLMPADSAAALQSGGACVGSALACGFTSGMTAVVFEPSGQADTVTVAGVGPGVLTLTDHVAPRAVAYGIDASVVEIVEVTYAYDPSTRTLRRVQNGVSAPIIDHVLDLEFRYLAAADRPREPGPVSGVANCLYTADGTYLHVATGALSAPVVLPVSQLTDGPFCGAGRVAFDLDLLRVRAVDVRIRLETGMDRLRGSDPALFARPGQAQDTRVIPDIVSSFTVGLRNHAR